MKTILATTYAVNPYKGSEDAMGWNYIYQAARFHRVIAVTRKNNRPEIERYMREYRDPVYANIEFLYYDLPKYQRWWKRGGRGALLYFLFWQRGVVNFVRRQDVRFDITHHLNFHNDWTPSYLWKLGKPFVWGPIGHHPRIPKAFTESLGVVDRLRNSATWAAKQYFWKMSPGLRRTREKADHVWCMNISVPQVIDLAGRKHHISPSVATQDFGWEARASDDEFRVLFAGRLVHMKGADLALKAFARFIRQHPGISASFTLVGDGPEKQSLARLVEALDLGDHVRRIEWIERVELMKIMQGASVFLFPSHEGAGMVVPEALSFGLPVVTLDNCGPGQFVAPEYGVVVPTTDYAGTVAGLAEGLAYIQEDKSRYEEMRRAARRAFEEKFHWDRRGETLRKIYASL